MAEDEKWLITNNATKPQLKRIPRQRDQNVLPGYWVSNFAPPIGGSSTRLFPCHHRPDQAAREPGTRSLRGSSKTAPPGAGAVSVEGAG